MNNQTYNIGSRKVLPKDIQTDLLRRVRAGDSEAREKVILNNVGFAYDTAFRYQSACNIEEDDLKQYSLVGLIIAVDRYNPDLINPVRISSIKSYELFAFERRKERLSQQLGRKASLTELIQACPEIKIEDMEILSSYQFFSMNQILPGEPRFEPADLAQLADENFNENEERQIIDLALGSLDERSEGIVRRYFGIGVERETMEVIGHDLGITRERVRQIKCNALKILKINGNLRGFTREILEDY
ncbi:sigma-70 family RNA polymerase sigma factor [Candidatus Woesearchaeota archaeon]|nr:sigma-70 family RNA polymerase sigma factor [Candidatus Woesearchaeota archaeon]